MNTNVSPPSYKYIAVHREPESDSYFSDGHLINEDRIASGDTLTTAWGMQQPQQGGEWEHQSGGFRLFPNVASLIINSEPANLQVVKVLFDDMIITIRGEARANRVHVVEVLSVQEVLRLIADSTSNFPLAVQKYMVENDYNVPELLEDSRRYDPNATLALYCASRGIRTNEIGQHPNTKVREKIAEKCTPEYRIQACYWEDVEDVVLACLRGGDFSPTLVRHPSVHVRCEAVRALSVLLKTTAWEDAETYRFCMVNFVSDNVSLVRSTVAECGYHHDTLIHDPVNDVRNAVRRNRNTLGDRIALFFSRWF